MKTYTELKNRLLEINKDLRLIIRMALSADGYDLSWHEFGAGGGRSYGGPYALTGSVLQAPGDLSGGEFGLQSGFWSGVPEGAPVTHLAYLPVILRGLVRR